MKSRKSVLFTAICSVCLIFGISAMASPDLPPIPEIVLPCEPPTVLPCEPSIVLPCDPVICTPCEPVICGSCVKGKKERPRVFASAIREFRDARVKAVAERRAVKAMKAACAPCTPAECNPCEPAACVPAACGPACDCR